MDAVRILFVCVGNSCRSIMAEALARSSGPDRVVAASAGIAPAGFVAEGTIRALEELGLDTRGLWSKGLDQLGDETFDVVVSLLGDRGLQVLPHGLGHRLEGWEIDDPFGEDLGSYRRVARELEQRVAALVRDELDRELPSI